VRKIAVVVRVVVRTRVMIDGGPGVWLLRVFGLVLGMSFGFGMGWDGMGCVV
jgi:hypothetical protein